MCNFYYTIIEKILLRMNTNRFRKFKLSIYIPTQAEIGILINSLGNAAQKFLFRVKNMGETR